MANGAALTRKVAFTMNHLRGRARIWGIVERERETPACSFASLGDGGLASSQSLLSTSHGSLTFEDYTTDFWTKACQSDWTSGFV